MGTETEVKIKITDQARFFQCLGALPADEISSRHFEDNFVLDFPDAGLRSQASLLRVRFSGAGATMTFKGPPRPDGIFKVREELEVHVGDGPTTIAIFERLGMKIWFRYQKYRREFAVRPAGGSGAPIHLAYDETPIGDYIELEGEEQDILIVARAMGIEESEFVRLSYYSLYRDYCEARGLSIGFMVFDPSGKIERECGSLEEPEARSQ